MLDWRGVYELVLKETSKSRILSTAMQIQSRNARMSFSSLADSARWLAADLAARGLDASDDSYPADGVTKIGERVMPLAWDVEDGELYLVEPDGSTKLLASYRRAPYSVVMFSGHTDGVVEAPLVYFEPRQRRGYLGWQDEDFEGLPIKGSCVFTEQRPDAVLLRKLIRNGAKGFILDGNGVKTAHHKHEPDAVRWVNDAFGEGMITQRTKTLPGFSISPRQGAELRKRLQAGEKLRARFRIESRTFDGEFNFVRGLLRGAARPDERVFLLAHLFEPNISNNCTGVAVNAEALAALKRLVDRGQLSPAARTIELFASWEMWGIAAYATKNPDVKRNGIAGVGIEALIRKDGPLGREFITLDAAHDSAPTFVNGLLNVLLDHFAAQSGLGWEERNAFTGNDNILSDPTLGPGTPFINANHQFTDGTYHTDADTPDRLDPDRLAHMAALVATTAYVIAGASADEALWFADKAYVRARRRIGEMADKAIDGTLDCVQERLSFLAEIERKSIASVRRLSQESAVQERVALLCGSLRDFTELETQRVSAILGEQKKPDRDKSLWLEAASMVPSRTFPGPICLQDVSDDVRREFEKEIGKSIYSVEWYGGTPDLFWVDGERSLAEICKLTQLLRPALCSDKALDAMMKLFRFLERHDCIKVKRG